jgi:hypothetical protein
VLFAWLILAVAVVVVAFPFWPGRMNTDTLNEIGAAKTGIYTNQYTPILEWLWHPFYKHGIGPGWVLTGQLVTFVVGAYVLLRRAFRPLGAALAVLIITITPQVYGELGLVGRDAWFLSFLVACFACTSKAFDAKGRRRIGWAVGAIAFAWLAQAARQNAVTSIFVPLAMIAGLFVVGRARPRRRPVLVWQATAIGIVAAVVIYGSQSVIDRAIGTHNSRSIGQLYLYDLANMSRINHHDYIPKSIDPTGSVQWLDSYTDIESSLALITGANPPIKYPFTAKAESTIEHRWKHEIIDHPFTYLRERLHEMQYTLGLGVDQIWIYHPYVQANPFGYTSTFQWADNLANDWMQLFTNSLNNGGIIFEPWIFLSICCIPIGLELRRHSTQRLILAGIGLSALTYQIGLFLAQLGPNYRYEFPCVAMTEIIIAVAVGRCWQHARDGSLLRADRASTQSATSTVFS